MDCRRGFRLPSLPMLSLVLRLLALLTRVGGRARAGDVPSGAISSDADSSSVVLLPAAPLSPVASPDCGPPSSPGTAPTPAPSLPPPPVLPEAAAATAVVAALSVVAAGAVAVAVGMDWEYRDFSSSDVDDRSPPAGVSPSTGSNVSSSESVVSALPSADCFNALPAPALPCRDGGAAPLSERLEPSRSERRIRGMVALVTPPTLLRIRCRRSSKPATVPTASTARTLATTTTTGLPFDDVTMKLSVMSVTALGDSDAEGVAVEDAPVSPPPLLSPPLGPGVTDTTAFGDGVLPPSGGVEEGDGTLAGAGDVDALLATTTGALAVAVVVGTTAP